MTGWWDPLLAPPAWSQWMLRCFLPTRPTDAHSIVPKDTRGPEWTNTHTYNMHTNGQYSQFTLTNLYPELVRWWYQDVKDLLCFMFVCVLFVACVCVCVYVCICMHKFLSWPAGQDCIWVRMGWSECRAVMTSWKDLNTGDDYSRVWGWVQRKVGSNRWVLKTWTRSQTSLITHDWSEQ